VLIPYFYKGTQGEDAIMTLGPVMCSGYA